MLMPRVPEPKTATGRIILSLRKGQGWSQRDLAKKAGVGQATVQRVESGEEHNPERNSLEAIAKAFGVTINELLPPSYADSQKVVDAFLASEWAGPAKLTEDERVWMLSQPITKWIGVDPDPKLVLEALELYRRGKAH